MTTQKPAKKPKQSKQSKPKTKGGDIINLAPLISAVLLASVKLVLENKKKAASATAATASKSRTRSR